MKNNIVYNEDKLYVYLEGNMNKRKLRKLKSKVSSIVNNFQINDLIVDTQKLEEYNDDYFDKMFNDYESSGINVKKI